jgi:hypothetical protein
VDDTERVAEIARLSERLSHAKARQAALAAEARDLARWLPAIRSTFGNPFFYSGQNHGRPENAEKSVDKYTGSTSHEVVLPTLLRLREVNRELENIRAQLRALGASAE